MILSTENNAVWDEKRYSFPKPHALHTPSPRRGYDVNAGSQIVRWKKRHVPKPEIPKRSHRNETTETPERSYRNHRNEPA